MPTRTVTAGARRLSTEKQVLMRDRALEIRDMWLAQQEEERA